MSSAAFSPDGTRVVTSFGRTAQLWDAASGREIATLAGHEASVFSTAFSPDGTHVLTASGDKTVRLWDAALGRDIATLAGHRGQVWSAAFSPDGTRVVTASHDNTARLWDPIPGGASPPPQGIQPRGRTPRRSVRTGRASSRPPTI